MDRRGLIEQALAHPDPEVRELATQALGEESGGVRGAGGAFAALVKVVIAKAIESGAAELLLKAALEWMSKTRPAPAGPASGWTA